MSASCGHHHASPSDPQATPPGLRRALWIALVANGAMFFAEMGGGWRAGSLALWADAIDFLGDTLAYAITLAVLGASLSARLRAARFKAVSMGAMGLWVLGLAIWRLGDAEPPHVPLMGAVAVAALITNVGVAWILYRYREGDANLRSVWLCSRNDAIGNLAVMGAALGVFGTGHAWPDLAVAGLMAALGLSAAVSVWRDASRPPPTTEPCSD